MTSAIAPDSLFSPENETAYQQWRKQKLADYPGSLDEISITIANPGKITAEETRLAMKHIEKTNMVIYCTDNQFNDKNLVENIGHHFGIQALDNNLYADEDAISSLAITSESTQKNYIPYTNKPITWHTDGYYNTGESQVRSMVLHCVTPALNGGSNRLLDHEIAYILLRDKNPDYIEALSRTDVMTIPANTTGGKEIRGEVTGPVFSTDLQGHLHMRYTARTRSIEWQNDTLVNEACNTLLDILQSKTPFHFEGTLQAGQGLLCNNVLHTRTAFEAGSQRLLYRGRFFDRINPSIMSSH